MKKKTTRQEIVVFLLGKREKCMEEDFIFLLIFLVKVVVVSRSMLKYLSFLLPSLPSSKNKRRKKRAERKMDGQAGQRLSSAVKRPVALHGACHK